LRAFEKRLTEVVNVLQPSMWRNRGNTKSFLVIQIENTKIKDMVILTLAILVLFIILTIFGAINWLSDPQTAKVRFMFESS
jgi:hypothetical protein